MVEPTNKFNKFARYKINIQKKSVRFLYSNNKLPKTEVKKTIPFIIASKTLKNLVINVIKEVK